MFSELVDRVVARAGRPDRILDAVSFVNQTLREVQADGLYYPNLIEDTVTPVASPYLMTNPVGFQRFKAAKINGTTDQWFLNRPPGKRQQFAPLRYYAASGYIGFTGFVLGESIDLAYYKFQPRLTYYAADARPASAVYNFDTAVYDFTYNDLTPADLDYTDPANQELARKKVTNWLLDAWTEMIEEGTLTKLLKTIGDEVRASTSYALYMNTRKESFRPTYIAEAQPGQSE